MRSRAETPLEMAMGDQCEQDDQVRHVVVYVNHADRMFSITARMTSARLPEVGEQMEGEGFEPIVLAHLPKEEAEAFKDAVRAAYEAAGYEYQTRSPLS